MKEKRSFFLYILVFLFSLAGFAALAGIVGVLQSWNWIAPFTSGSIPAYILFRESFLFLANLTAAIALWKRITWSIIFATITSILTTVWFWLDRLLLAENKLPAGRNVVLLIISCILLGFVLLTLYVLEPTIHIHSMPPSGEKNGTTSS
jgi:hypothetical protein